MSAWLPMALLPVAGVLALILVWPRLKVQPSNTWLVGEAIGATLVAVAMVWVAWILLYLAEQRW